RFPGYARPRGWWALKAPPWVGEVPEITHAARKAPRPPAVCADRGQPSGAPGDGELVLGVLDALLELPAVGRRLAAFDLLELGLRALELLARALVVDLARLDRVVDECDRAVLEHLEEAGAGRELLDLVSVEVRVHARRARLQQRDERRVPREDADLAGLAGDDD